MSRPRSHVLVFVLVSLACVGGFLAWVFQAQVAARAIVRNEDAVREDLERVAEGQRAHLAATAGYGFVSELRDAGRLDGLVVASEGPTSYVETAGYRIDVLLPTARNAEGEVSLVREGAGRVHRDLRKRHFAIVARPLQPRRSGYRIYYLDERGEVYLSDLVSDERGSLRNPLPRVHKATTADDGDGLIWVREAELELSDRP